MSEVCPLLLAFGFGDPLLLTGLSLAGIPLLIHLLHRRRYVETPWAAMRFLIEATRKQSRRLRLEHLILLLLRTLMLALLVLALARPHSDSAAGVLTGNLPVHRIIVLDATMSMQFQDDAPLDSDREEPGAASATRFARAVKLVHELLQQGQRGDAWNLVRIADREPLTIVAQPSFSPDTVDAELQELTVTDAAANLPAVLEAVLDLTKQVSELPRKEVLFVTDLQASTWIAGNGAERDRLKSLLKQIAEHAKLSVLNVAGAEAPNAAVTGIELESPLVSVGKESRLTCTLKNFGSSVLKSQIVELLVDDRIVDTRRIDLPAGVDVSADWAQTLQTSGEHKIEVRLENDGLPIDNRRWLALPVRDEIRVLLVDGRPSGNRRQSASFYVARALAPSSPGEAATSSIHPQIVSESELPGTNLAHFDVVVLCNVGLMTERESGLLEAFVRGGRGLVVFPGDLTNADSYNLRLYRAGQGILPAKLGEHISAPDRENPFTFDARGFAHPLVSIFQGNPGAGLEATLTFDFLRLVPASDAAVALWFNNGAPALVEKPAGTGRTILAATSTDDRWGTWAIWAPSFVPLMHETIAFAIGNQWRQRQVNIGRPLVITLATRGADGSAVIIKPNGTSEEIDFEDRDGVPTVVYSDTTTAGFYTIDATGPASRTELHAVNIDTQESDLTPITQQEFQAKLFGDLEVQLRGDKDTLAGPVLSQVSSTMTNVIRWLTLTVLMALILEPLMAWRFPVGMTGLVVAVIAAAAAVAGGWWGGLGVGAAALATVFLWHRKHPTDHVSD